MRDYLINLLGGRTQDEYTWLEQLSDSRKIYERFFEHLVVHGHVHVGGEEFHKTTKRNPKTGRFEVDSRT